MWGFALVLVSLMGAKDVPDDVLKVRLEASAPGVGAAGRIAALERAKKQAIEKVVEGLASQVDPRLLKPLVDRAPYYVRSCEVVDQKQKGATTELEVEAYILDRDLRRDLASIVLPLFPRVPRVAVVIVEAQGEAPPDWAEETPGAEAQLIDTFKDAGLEVVDPETLRAQCSGEELMNRIRGDASAAAKFARENFADVAVVGEATVSSEPATERSNLGTTRATVTVRVIRAVDARTFDAQTGEAVVQSLNPAEGSAIAVSDACGKIRQAVLVSAVLAVAAAESSDNLVVTIDGLESATQWERVCEALGRLPGVEEVEDLFFTGAVGRARVNYTGEIPPFVDRLAEEGVAGVRLEPQRVVDRDMTLVIRD